MATMKSTTPTAIIDLSTEAAWVDVLGPDGHCCEEPLRSRAEEALREAMDTYGGSLYLSDGDTKLDCEEVFEFLAEIVGIVSRRLASHGYVVAVLNDLWGRPEEDPEPEARPVPWPGTVWSCYACKEVLRASAPYSAGCPGCLGQPRYHEHGGNPGGCPYCGGALELLCDDCDLRERRWQEGEDVPMPKPPEPQGDA